MGRWGRKARRGLAATVVGALFATAPAWAAKPADPSLSNGNPPGTPCAEGWELDPVVAVNPADQRNIVLAWNQQTAAGYEIVAAASVDGGKSWSQAVAPGITTSDCSLGAGTTAATPALSFGPDGRVYLTAMRNIPNVGDTETVLTSTDHGRPGSWSTPVDLGPGNRGSVVADPVLSGVAYATFLFGPADQSESIMTRRTTDGGRTWSSATVAYLPGGDTAIGPSLAVTGHDALGRAQLVITFHGGVDLNTCCTYTYAVRSTDGGMSWEGPVNVAALGPRTDTANYYAVDPEGGCPVYDGLGDGVGVAAGEPGEAYAVWSNVDPHNAPDTGQVLISRMTSGSAGATWSEPVVVNEATASSSQVYEPRVAVSSDGVVGVLFYDDRNDAPGDTAWTNDLWFATSTDHGATWTEMHVAGPFDLRSILQSNGVSCPSFTDYVGLTASGPSFAASYLLGPGLGAVTGATEGPTDVFYSRLH